MNRAKFFTMLTAGTGITYLLYRAARGAEPRYQEEVPVPPPFLLAWSAAQALKAVWQHPLGGFSANHWVNPVPEYLGLTPQINARFGEPRGGGTVHPGVDLDFFSMKVKKNFAPPWASSKATSPAFMPPNLPALAAADGEVYAAGLAPPRTYYPNSSSGWYVGIKHPNGALTVYVHLMNNFVEVGEQVVQGQPLGIMANDYGVGGNRVNAIEGGIVHLHYQTYYGGKLVDPEPMFLRRATVLKEPNDVKNQYADYLSALP